MSDNHIMNTDHWLQYYNHSLAGQMTAASNVTSSADATIVSTAAAAATNSPGMNASGYGAAAAAANPNLNPDGRVTKPARRRSRASRRTPTTLLNTDTTNFRAMVQQYTGGPSASFPTAAGFSIGGPAGFNVGHGAGLHQQHHHSMIANQLGMGAPAGTNYREGDHGSGGFRLQFQQPAQYMFGGNNNVRPNMMELASEDQIGMEGLGPAYGAGRAPPPHGDSSSGENKSRNSFLF